MARCYPVIVALLMIYPHKTGAASYNFCKTDIERHLREERAPHHKKKLFGGSSSSSSAKFEERDSVSGLNDHRKRAICNAVAEHLVPHDNRHQFDSFIAEESNLQIPNIAQRIIETWRMRPLLPAWIRIKDLDMDKPMYWCGPRRYNIVQPDSESESEQEIESDWEPASSTSTDRPPLTGQIYGFFFAGSTKHKSRIYVFRTPVMEAEEVAPVAEVNY